VKSLFAKLDAIEKELDSASDTHILKGKGTELNNSLKALKEPVLRARQKHPDSAQALVERYNDLSKRVPVRINGVFAEYNSSPSQQKPPVLKSFSTTCSQCGKNLSGDVIEVAGAHFHREYFACSGCGFKLGRTCLKIGNKPYCDGCGKQAFVNHTLGCN